LFDPNPELLSFSKKDWEEITAETFQKVFKDSPLKRTKWEGFIRNIQFLK
jgi:epoxyqueuosine reductase